LDNNLNWFLRTYAQKKPRAKQQLSYMLTIKLCARYLYQKLKTEKQ